MRLVRLSEDALVQFDGDEPESNRDYYSGVVVGAAQKRVEHEDYLRGEYRTKNSDKVVRAVKSWRAKHPRKAKRVRPLGEVTDAAKIPAEKVDDILDRIKTGDRYGYSSYDTRGASSPLRVVDWQDAADADR